MVQPALGLEILLGTCGNGILGDTCDGFGSDSLAWKRWLCDGTTTPMDLWFALYWEVGEGFRPERCLIWMRCMYYMAGITGYNEVRRDSVVDSSDSQVVWFGSYIVVICFLDSFGIWELGLLRFRSGCIIILSI